MLLISAIVIARNEGADLRRTVECLEATLPAESEIVVVDDGSSDGCAGSLAADGRVRMVRSDGVGVAQARNRGAAQARGQILVFADAHITAEPGWWKPLVKLLEAPSIGAVAPVIADAVEPECKAYGVGLAGPDLTIEWLQQRGESPYPVPILPGCCLAMRQDTFQAAGGFDDGLICWGGVDNELGVRLWLLGYELLVAPEVEVRHQFRTERPFPVEWSWVLHNRLRLAFLHFSAPRIARVVEALRGHEDFAAAVALTVESDVAARRAQLASRRLYDDEWFFRRFELQW